MEVNVNENVDKMKVPYIIIRLLTLLGIALLFVPSVSPTNFIEKAGNAPFKHTSSFFSSGMSFNSWVGEKLERAFDMGWLDVMHFKIMMLLTLLFIVGMVVLAVGVCMSLGNLKMRNVGNGILLGGAITQFIGMLGVFLTYKLITSTMNADKIIVTFPVGMILFLSISVVLLVLAVCIFVKTPKAEEGAKMEMETKYKLFLMLMPFLFLVFAFSYLPLFSWRYAFYDYAAGDELSSENFVGFKNFLTLIQNKTYVDKLISVLTNTLALSGLGLLTSWVPMFFAIFLTEVKSARFKRFVQLFTTVPNFISWVLVYAIAFAIFNTDGFINVLINNLGGNSNTNYLDSTSHMWIKMLLWGMWKGTGWSAIIYISGIAGIDQQLYEAATVDGAGRFQKMRYITLPGLLPTYVVMLVMSIAGILSNGMDQYLVFETAANRDKIEVLDLYVYNLGIGDGQIPLSTVVGMTKSIISVALLFVANKASKLIRGENVV